MGEGETDILTGRKDFFVVELHMAKVHAGGGGETHWRQEAKGILHGTLRNPERERDLWGIGRNRGEKNRLEVGKVSR